jgi:maltooligosyltrehalose trehalohydrolase
VRIGVHYPEIGRCKFTVWAPLVKKMELEVISLQRKIVPMEQNERGYWKIAGDDLFPGIRYLFNRQ